MPDGASYQDPIEYAPISTAIDALVGVCGGVRDDDHPDIALYVRVPNTTDGRQTTPSPPPWPPTFLRAAPSRLPIFRI